MMQNTGIHHVSVLVRSAKKAYDFYTNILGTKDVFKDRQSR
ncbi:VOC family protein [Enterococcus cecorum]